MPSFAKASAGNTKINHKLCFSKKVVDRQAIIFEQRLFFNTETPEKTEFYGEIHTLGGLCVPFNFADFAVSVFKKKGSNRKARQETARKEKCKVAIAIFQINNDINERNPLNSGIE